MYYCDDLELKAIEKVLKNKKLFRYQGKDIETECSKFEMNFANYLGSKKSILLSSGTNAIVNALFTLGISEGDEVIIPAYTFFATASAILELKAVPVVVNINYHLSYDQQDLKNKITPKTKALIAVHMDGYSCDMDYLVDFCKDHNILLIEDVAQAVGGKYKNKKLGTIGIAGCFSFNVDKIISCGEGGALVLNDEKSYQKALLYHDSCNQFGATLKDFYTIPKFSGKSMRVSEIQGAMINIQLQRLDTILKDLRERKNILETHLEKVGMEFIASYDTEGDCSTTCRILCKDPAAVNKLVLDFNQKGIKTNSPMLRPAHHVWQWQFLLNSVKPQNKFDYLHSIDILSRVLLIHISLDSTLEEWKKTVEAIRV